MADGIKGAFYTLKDGKSNKLIVDEGEIVFDYNDIKNYYQKFQSLVEQCKIINNDFTDNVWILAKKNNKVRNINLDFKKWPGITIIIKCLVLILLENGNTAGCIQSNLALLKKVLQKSNCFQSEMVEEFELFLNEECTNSQLSRIKRITIIFLGFSSFRDIDNYIDVLSTISIDNSGVRKLPDYKSILTFHHSITEIIITGSKKAKLKFYPLFLWWIITSVIPLRPSEFLELEYNCCYKDDEERYWIKLPRQKVKQTSTKNKIEIVDILETTEDIYNFINEYKSLQLPQNKSQYLISYRAYNSFLKYSDIAMCNKKNVEIMELSSIQILFDHFYKEIINDSKVTPLKPGDSRHLAFCNMLLQGFNPLTIARIGGHTSIRSQMHYYQHLDTYADSYVFTMAEKLKINNYLRYKNASGKYDALRRSRLISTFSLDQISTFLEIDKGYCTVKNSTCEDFSDCETDECCFCKNHILNIKKYPEVINEISGKADKLGIIIRDQIDLIKSVSKQMFIDYSNETISYEGNKRLLSTSQQLQDNLRRKAILDSYLFDYVTEDMR